MTGLALGGIAVIAIGGFAALQFAIARNGPAVLDTVDRIAGRNSDAALAHAPLSYGEHPEQRLFVHQPQAARDASPVIVFIHGGSWASGDPSDYGFVARNLVPHGFVVVNAGYRLADDGRYPAMLEDTAASLAWVKANITRFGGDPGRVYLMGHSAGAYNAVMIALDDRWLAAEGLTSQAIEGVIGLAGPYDFLPITNPDAKRAFGQVEPIEDTQPINYARAGTPPLLLLQGEQDTTVGSHNTRNLTKRLTSLGAEVEARYFAELDHAGILTALANPWRDRQPVIDAVLRFTGGLPQAKDTASVSVQGETG